MVSDSVRCAAGVIISRSQALQYVKELERILLSLLLVTV